MKLESVQHKFFAFRFISALNLRNDFFGCVLSTRDSIFTPSPHGIT